MMGALTIIFTILITIAAYIAARFLFLRYNNPLLNVVLLGMILVIAVLTFFDLPYSAYEPGKEIMTFLLGPATVALAIPVYNNMKLLRQYGLVACVSVAAGSLVSVVTAVLIVKCGGLGREVMIAVAPKSVTAPIAVEIAQIAGGDPALAAAFVVATGTFGAALGPTLLTWFRFTKPVARGLALGTVAHAQGVAMSLLEGEDTGAMASSAMALAAVFTSLVAPFLLAWLVNL
jgi:predicted murein hydrolase (TIGR00659 family)